MLKYARWKKTNSCDFCCMWFIEEKLTTTEMVVYQFRPIVGILGKADKLNKRGRLYGDV